MPINAADIRKLDDLLTYPVLTEQVNNTGAPGGSPAGSKPGVGNLGRVIESTIKDVLGWRPRKDDPKGFAAALTQSFGLRDVEGHTEWRYTPRGYSVQADLGAVTGAQASIYKRAKLAVDEAVPLLDGLKPLRADADPEDMAAIRAIVRQELLEIVAELATEGGPRVEYINERFALLVGPEGPAVPCGIEGQLAVLADRFGMDPARVNTVTEEQILTNFQLLEDYICGLRISWITFRDSFGGDSPTVFLGTQLIQLSRALAAVSEGVQEVYFAMDSVFMGPEERQVSTLTFKAEKQKMFVADLLRWVAQFAESEGPSILTDGGKDGVFAFRTTAAKLRGLVLRARLESHKKPLPSGEQDPDLLPDAYGRARVQTALTELGKALDNAAQLARNLRRTDRPIIESVEPRLLSRARSDAMVVIAGENFERGMVVNLVSQGGTPTHANHVLFVDTTELLVIFDLAADATPDGDYDVFVQLVRDPTAKDTHRAAVRVGP